MRIDVAAGSLRDGAAGAALRRRKRRRRIGGQPALPLDPNRRRGQSGAALHSGDLFFFVFFFKVETGFRFGNTISGTIVLSFRFLSVLAGRRRRQRHVRLGRSARGGGPDPRPLHRLARRRPQRRRLARGPRRHRQLGQSYSSFFLSFFLSFFHSFIHSLA